MENILRRKAIKPVMHCWRRWKSMSVQYIYECALQHTTQRVRLSSTSFNSIMLLSLKIPSQFNFLFWLLISSLTSCYKLIKICLYNCTDSISSFHYVFCSTYGFQFISRSLPVYRSNWFTLSITCIWIFSDRKTNCIWTGEKSIGDKAVSFSVFVWNMNYRNRTTITMIQIVHDAENKHWPAQSEEARHSTKYYEALFVQQTHIFGTFEL